VHIRHSWTIWMRIAAYNVNGVNGRLANLLGWLEEAAPNVVCLRAEGA
jgi:exonuclease III